MHRADDPSPEPASDAVVEDAVVEDESAEPGKTRRRAPGADPEVRSFGAARTCAADGCGTRLSRYNPDSYCSVHRGWDRQVVTRRRRGDEELGAIGDPGATGDLGAATE